MIEIYKLIDGKKTYITAIALLLVAAAQFMGYPIPEAAWTILTAFGLISGRSAIAKIEKGDAAALAEVVAETASTVLHK